MSLTRSRCFHSGEPSEPLDDGQRLLVAEFNTMLKDGSLALRTTACLCGATEDYVTIASFDRYGLAQPTVICRRCGLMQSQPSLDGEAYARFYSSDLYRKLYNPSLMKIDRAAFDERVAHAAYRHRFIMDGYDGTIDKVLEIGCGGGWNLWPWHQAGKTVLGYDYGPTLVGFGRSLGMDLREGSIADVTDRAFDLIILSHVLEHFLDPVEEMKRIAALLAPGGQIYIEVPNADTFCLGHLQNAHTYYFTAPTLQHYLARAGLHCDAVVPAGPHIAGLFRLEKSDRDVDLSSEFLRISRLVRERDRREKVKELLDRFGILSLARILRGNRK